MSDSIDTLVANGVLKSMGKKPLPPAKPEKVPTIPIVRFPDPRLEMVCRPVPEDSRKEAEALSVQMLDAMKEAKGWGLAAPQVGVLWRMFVMDVRYMRHRKDGVTAPYIFVNPEIRDVSETLVSINEGCLSFPGLFERLVRPESVLLAWHDVHTWDMKVAAFDGLEARVILHESEHLEGKLLVHHLSPVAQKKLRKRANAGRRL